jgi:hypothetical protein
MEYLVASLPVFAYIPAGVVTIGQAAHAHALNKQSDPCSERSPHVRPAFPYHGTGYARFGAGTRMLPLVYSMPSATLHVPGTGSNRQPGGNGDFEVFTAPSQIEWAAEMDGYAEKSGRHNVFGETVELGAIRLAELPNSVISPRLRVSRVAYEGMAAYTLNGQRLFSADELVNASVLRNLATSRTGAQAIVVRRGDAQGRIHIQR